MKIPISAILKEQGIDLSKLNAEQLKELVEKLRENSPKNKQKKEET